MAFGHEKKFHFYVAVKFERMEALWKHMELTGSHSLSLVSGPGEWRRLSVPPAVFSVLSAPAAAHRSCLPIISSLEIPSKR